MIFRILFDWDEENLSHIARHHVSPEEAEEVLLNDPLDLEYQDQDGEERTLQIGLTLSMRFLAVATTLRSGRIRVITAYPATPKQQLVYLRQRAFL